MPPKIAAALLWIGFAAGVALLIAMTWHPWVIGDRSGCANGSAKAWDGHCYPPNQ